MSWEGYYQCICEKGHYFIGGPHLSFVSADEAYVTVETQEGEDCPHCKSPAVFTNIVDDTNCDSVGEIPLAALQPFKIADAITETCAHCGHVKRLEPARFRVPDEVERKRLRYWRPGYGGTPLVKLEGEEGPCEVPDDAPTEPIGDVLGDDLRRVAAYFERDARCATCEQPPSLKCREHYTRDLAAATARAEKAESALRGAVGVEDGGVAMGVGYLVINILPFLDGKPWDDVTRAYLRAVRPAAVRVVERGGGIKLTPQIWRVTVYLTAEHTVARIEQEVEVDLPEGVRNGWELECRLHGEEA